MSTTQSDLVSEARRRGYRKGTPIKYVPWAIDYVEGNYIEVNADGDVVAYEKPKNERKSFDDQRFDRLYDSHTGVWVEIVKKGGEGE